MQKDQFPSVQVKDTWFTLSQRQVRLLKAKFHPQYFAKKHRVKLNVAVQEL